LRTLILIFCLLGLSGCISYHHEGDERLSQTPKIVDGTDSQWLLDHLGEPLHRKLTEKGTEIWHYRFSEKEKTKVSLFLLFRVSSESDSEKNLFLELEEDRVVDHWYD